ncbi:MAG: hypothetical protein ACOC0Q_10530, partial [Wenzhouxiangella sp.]
LQQAGGPSVRLQMSVFSCGLFPAGITFKSVWPDRLGRTPARRRQDRNKVAGWTRAKCLIQTILADLIDPISAEYCSDRQSLIHCHRGAARRNASSNQSPPC